MRAGYPRSGTCARALEIRNPNSEIDPGLRPLMSGKALPYRHESDK